MVDFTACRELQIYVRSQMKQHLEWLDTVQTGEAGQKFREALEKCLAIPLIEPIDQPLDGQSQRVLTQDPEQVS